MSFWKHEPPKPTDARRNLGPMRESKPTACATSSMFAPVASQIAESAFTDEMRCASIAFAASLDSSDDQSPTVRMRSRLVTPQSDCGFGEAGTGSSVDTYGTQLAYTSASASHASLPSCD